MKRNYALVTLAVFLVSSIPYVYGYAVQGPGMRFTGIVFDVPDTAQYFAWMRSFSHSALIANPLTPEPGAERFFNLQWWLLGVLAFKTPLGAVVTYQILRVVALAAFAGALAWFCRLVIPRRAFLAFCVVMLSSGLGWIWVVRKQWTGELSHPLDVQVGEANTYFAAMAFPHLLLAAAAMLAIFCLFLGGVGERRWRYSGLAAVLTLALGFSHGYDLIPTMAIPLLTVGVLTLRERRLPELTWPAAAIVVAAGPGALYAVGLTRLDETWRGVLGQYGNAGVYTPLPHHLVILLGVPLLLAIWQVRPAAWQNLDHVQLFVRVWLVAGFALAYIPTDFQIKMLTGYQVPLGILAVQTLGEIRWPALLPERRRLALPAALLLVVVATNVYLTAWRVVDLRREQYPYYMSAGDIAALERLDDFIEPGEVVLSSEMLGLFVPVYSDGRPFLAHWAQTLRYYERRDLVRQVYSSPDASAAFDEFLREHRIAFIIAGPAEAQEAGVTLPIDMPLETMVAGSTMVYRTHEATGLR